MSVHDSAAINEQARNMARNLVRDILRTINIQVFRSTLGKAEDFSAIISDVAETFEVLLKERKA
jgi:hypothetical protein